MELGSFEKTCLKADKAEAQYAHLHFMSYNHGNGKSARVYRRANYWAHQASRLSRKLDATIERAKDKLVRKALVSARG